MKVSALGASLIFLSSTGALAADGLLLSRPAPLRDMVTYIESQYRGEVVAIALDTAGDKAPHYHVDVRYPGASAALKLDVDASSLKAAVRSTPHPGARWMTLADAATLAATRVGGKAIAAEIDAIGGRSPHYDVDVRLQTGQIARLKVDPLTSQLGWRMPAIVAN